MANKQALRFCKSLFSAFGKWKVPEEVKETYTEKIGKWFLTEDQWSRTLSRIVADFEDLPPLARIYDYLKASTAMDSAGSEPIALGFWLNGLYYVLGKDTGKRHPKTGQRMWAVAAVDPGAAPTPPSSATEPRLIIPPNKQAQTEPCGQAEGRKAFVAGFLSVCSDPDKCKSMMRVMYPGEFGEKRQKALICL